MELQEFAQQYPELYNEMLSRVQAFIDQHNITGDVPLIEWDDMLDMILYDLPLDQYTATGEYPATGGYTRYEPAVTTAGPVRPGLNRPPAQSRPPVSSNRPPVSNRPPAQPRPPYGGYGPGNGPVKDALRLLFLRELIG